MRDTPLISIFHPTARVVPFPPSLPLGWRHASEAFYAACDNPEQVEYVLCVHESRWSAFWRGPLVAEFPAWGAVRVVCNRGPDTNVAQINAAACQTRGRLLVGIMDDLFPPEHWDTLLVAAVPGLDGEYVIHCDTGSPMDDELINAGAMTRARFKRTGYLVYPGYESMYCDNDLSAKARRDGVVIAARHIRFEHRHPVFNLAEWDSVYGSQNRPKAYEIGAGLFKLREAAGFPDMPDFVPPCSEVFNLVCSPGAALVAGQGWEATGVAVETEPLPAAPRVLAVALPGEHFSSAWVSNWTPLLGELMQRFAVQTHFAYSSNVYATRSMLFDSLTAGDALPDLVLWVDDDNVLPPDVFGALLFALETDPGIDCVAAWCWIQPDTYSIGVRVSCGRFGPDGECVPLDPAELLAGGLVPIDYTGFPAVLLRGSMLRRVGESPFCPVLGKQHKWGFAGEDSSFFLRAKASGCRVVVAADAHIVHLKLRPAGPVDLALSADAESQFENARPRATEER
jgi:hypothetical protein